MSKIGDAKKILNAKSSAAVLTALFVAVGSGIVPGQIKEKKAKEEIEIDKLFPRYTVETVIDYEKEYGEISTIVNEDIYDKKDYNNLENVDMLLYMIDLSNNINHLIQNNNRRNQRKFKKSCSRLLKNEIFISNINNDDYLKIYNLIGSYNEKASREELKLLSTLVNSWLLHKGYQTAFDYCKTVILWQLQSIDPNIKTFDVEYSKYNETDAGLDPIIITNNRKYKMINEDILNTYLSLEKNIKIADYNYDNIVSYNSDRNDILKVSTSQTTHMLFEIINVRNTKDFTIIDSNISKKLERKVKKSIEEELITNDKDSTISQPEFHTYIIKPGDSIIKLANTYGFSISAFKKLNPEITNLDYIEVGQQIIIPSSSEKEHTTNNGYKSNKKTK